MDYLGTRSIQSQSMAQIHEASQTEPCNMGPLVAAGACGRAPGRQQGAGEARRKGRRRKRGGFGPRRARTGGGAAATGDLLPVARTGRKE